MEPTKPTDTSHREPDTHTEDVPVATPPAPVSEATETSSPDTERPPADKTDTLQAVAPENVTEPEPEPDPVSAKPANITAPIFVSRSYTFPEILTSFGFASIFFVYAAVAYLHPDALQSAYTANSIGKSVGHAALAVEASMFVNLFLGALLLLGRRKTIVYALAGSWLIVIAVFKVLNLLG